MQWALSHNRYLHDTQRAIQVEETTPTLTPVPQEPDGTYFTVSTIVIIVAIAIAVVLLLRKS